MQNQATSTDNIVVKTIYDPCPVGYTVAPVNAFSGMTDTNGWNSTDKGSLQQGCWFPGVGGRANSSGAPTNVGPVGWFWQAVPSNTDRARELCFNGNSNYVNPVHSNPRSWGFSIRPVEEIEEKK